MLRTTILIGLLAAYCLGSVRPAAADTSWLPRWMGGKSDEVVATKHRHTTRNASSKDSNVFSDMADWFKPRKKKRVVSKYPSTDRVRVSHDKDRDDRPWYSRMFTPQEPSPPRSIDEWMELDQIKP